MKEQDPLDRYRRLVDQSGVGLFETAVDGRVLWVNPAAARIVGYDTPEEFVAAVHDIRDLYINPELRDEFVRISTRQGSVTEFEYEIRHKSGGVRWISVSSRSRFGPTGGVTSFEGTVIDVTERKLIEAATAAIGSDLNPNEAVTRFADVLQRVVPFRQISLTIIEGAHYRRIVSVAGPGGEPLPAGEVVPLAHNPMGWAVEKGQHLVVEDTSNERWPFDRKLAAAGVGSYAIFPLVGETGVFATFNIGMAQPSGLPDDVVGLLSALTGAVAQGVQNILIYEREHEAVERLEAVNEMKNDLVASVAHDLKTPLALISGFAALLRENAESWSPDDRSLALDGISRNVERISRLVRQDLTAAVLERDEITFSSGLFDMGNAVRQAVEDAAMISKTHEFDVRVDGDKILVRGDEERNQQVLDNLLSNAIKFSPPRSRIEAGARRNGDHIEVWVADAGPGIPERDLGLLFKKRKRLTKDGEGAGLGLYICKAIVEGQGGTIAAGRSPSGGALFTFTLPAGEDAP